MAREMKDLTTTERRELVTKYAVQLNQDLSGMKFMALKRKLEADGVTVEKGMTTEELRSFAHKVWVDRFRYEMMDSLRRRMTYEIVEVKPTTTEPVAADVEGLLAQLKEAKEAKDAARAKKIRVALRKKGYYISKQEN